MSELSTFEILQKARAVIASPLHWCKHSRDDRQGRHCAIGAIEKILDCVRDDSVSLRVLASVMTEDEAVTAISYFESGQGGGLFPFPHLSPAANLYKIVALNNATDHATVLSLFDRAIAKLEAPQKQVKEIMANALKMVQQELVPAE